MKIDKSDSVKLLNLHGLKATNCRIMVLDLFSSRTAAITYSELDALVKAHVNRVSIYRTLKGFEEKGIIHRISDLNGTVFFAINQGAGPTNHMPAATEHLHFNCVKCKNIFCLDDLKNPRIKLPKDYEIISLNIMITGVCRLCSSDN